MRIEERETAFKQKKEKKHNMDALGKYKVTLKNVVARQSLTYENDFILDIPLLASRLCLLLSPSKHV